MAAFQGNSKIYSSLHFWNLDRIQLKKSVTGKGKVERWTLDENSGPIATLAFDDKERLWVIRPNIRAIQVVEMEDSQPRTVVTWSTEENIVDIVYSMIDGIIYILDACQNRILELGAESFAANPIECSELKQWALSPYSLDSQSRLAMRTETLDGTPIAYVTLPEKAGIIQFPLITNGTPSPLKFDWHSDIPGSRKLGAPAGVCVDELADALLVADTQEHRVIELDLGDAIGESRVGTKLLCGTAKAGYGTRKSGIDDFADGGPPNREPVNTPWDVQIYRYADYIDQKLLTRRGIEQIRSDDTGLRPRCILVADMDNHRIRKIVQSKRNETLLTLIGNGSESDLPHNSVVAVPTSNLLTVSVRTPCRMTISPLGKLAFGSRQSHIITILHPATANIITTMFPSKRIET